MTDTPPDFYIPLAFEAQFGPAHPESLLHRRGANWLYLLGRIKPGTDLKQLQAKMSGSLRSYLATIETYEKADRAKFLAD